MVLINTVKPALKATSIYQITIYNTVKPVLKATSIYQITIYKGQSPFSPLRNSTYNFYKPVNKGQLLIKATFSGSLEWPLYTGLTVVFLFVYLLAWWA
jgi:hypothetical protein